jgi:tetratricopeptide (TPR) repeat protein
MTAESKAEPLTAPKSRLSFKLIRRVLCLMAIAALLIHPGTRRLLRFNLQQAIPPREGHVLHNIWQMPRHILLDDSTITPFWAKWPEALKARRDDWRVHAARGACPSFEGVYMRSVPLWGEGGRDLDRLRGAFDDDERPVEDMDFVAEALLAYDEATRLATPRPALYAGRAGVWLQWHRALHLNRCRNHPKPGACPENSPDCPRYPRGAAQKLPTSVFDEICGDIRKVRELDPENGYGHLLAARLAFALGEDAEAYAALDRALKAPRIENYGREHRENLNDFMESVGAPRYEARLAVESFNTRHDPSRILAAFLLGIAKEHRLHERHTEAVRHFRYAVAVYKIARVPRIECWADLIAWRAFYDTSVCTKAAVAEAAIAYFEEHEAGDLAQNLRTSWERYAARVEATTDLWPRHRFVRIAAYSILFSAAMLLAFWAVVWVVVLIGRRFVSAEPPQSPRALRRIDLHLLCLASLGVLLYAMIELTLLCNAHCGSDGSQPDPRWLFFIPPALLILASALWWKWYVPFHEGFARVLSAGIHHVLPTALAYAECAYPIFILAAYLLRLRVYELSFSGL